MRSVLASMAVMAGACAVAPAQTAGPDLAFVGTLPDSCDLVIATGPLGELRATPAWRCVRGFVSDLAGWDRSIEAWGQVAGALGLTPSEVMDEVLDGGVVLATSGLTASEREPHVERALLCEVRPAIEARLRERLRPAPRALDGSLPVLALENGAFDLAACVREGSDRSRVIVAPRGSDSLFDELLPVVRGTAAASPLHATREWAHVAALPPGVVMVLFRDLHPEPPPARGGPVVMPGERFIAATIAADAGEVKADVVATRSLMLPRRERAFGTGLTEAVPASWPGEAVAWAFEGAVLAVAGNPAEQPPDDAFGLLDSGGALLPSLLDRLDLPGEDEPASGVAIVTIHAPPAGEAGRWMTVAMPLADVESSMAASDAWGVAFAGRTGLEVPASQPDSIRVLTIEGAEGATSGAIAWCYARSPGERGGWLVVQVQAGAHDRARAAGRVRDLAERLGKPLDPGVPTLYRLEMRPSALAAMTPTGEHTAAALRWVDRVSTSLRRAPNGLVRGSFTATFDTSRLEPR